MKAVLYIALQALQLQMRSGALWIALFIEVCTITLVFYYSGVDGNSIDDLPLRLKYSLWSLFAIISLILISFITTFQANALAQKLYHTLDITPISRFKHFIGRFVGFYVISFCLLKIGVILLLMLSYNEIRGKNTQEIEFLFHASTAIQSLDPITEAMVDESIKSLSARRGSEVKLENDARIELKNKMRQDRLLLLPNESISWRFMLPASANSFPWEIKLRAEGQNPDLVIQSRWKLSNDIQSIVVEKIVPFTVKQNPEILIPAHTFKLDEKSLNLSIYNPEKMILFFPYEKGPFLYIEHGSWINNALNAYIAMLVWLLSLILFSLMLSSLFEYASAMITIAIPFFLGLFYDYFYSVLTEQIGKLFFLSGFLAKCVQTFSALAPPEVINSLTSGVYITILEQPSFWISHIIIITCSLVIVAISLPHCELEKEGNLT